MFIDFLLNIALIISGIYLFYRIQFFEDKKIVETGLFQSLLMTTLSILSLLVPFSTSQGEFALYFIPLLILAAYNAFYYGLISAVVVYFFYHFIFDHSIATYIVFIVLYMLYLMAVPFIRKITHIKLVAVNIIFTSLYMIIVNQFFYNISLMTGIILLVVTSLIIFVAHMMYEDINTIYKLNKRIDDDEFIDYLTQLGNVKMLDKYVDEHFENDDTLSLLLIDIDSFKNYNDKHSYDSGDKIISQMASLLKNYVPTGGHLFRNSGEEFAMIIPNLSFDKTVRLGEAIRNSVEYSKFHINEIDTVNVTVSIGAGYKSTTGATKRDLVKEAESALFEAKKMGQNRVMFAPIG
ncbi:putative diguanylate cyclase YdaM [Jeotgalicoccus aerolatus]|uniref:Diguanylate cyclase (GGDEF) domain-containing protein n=1 Tax=Jeotgalicoccus aerolatus TaxID=709510 RepID=A0A1G8ZGW9_9STAP|nr:GGDEF domain-containing protein [Jeotgalicoccus aerolatus]MBP1951143.1 diguanylate cyclase (GGDEF)-like protein [Jeotgalicoccus aerolatus]NMA81358.1 diguanylate cyclase [Jeotgalicoccus aerolatus]CAD2077901.1 putative diguanylate cyclase YdaM [Jeotgalicoccus aerolatus]SDK14366.1 diguanylate cyclase (GGDEF) domain-containing protein [Jeotgalicoccus aerolatus]GGD99936.1 putative membrane protein [Jeotgalicoccus aerolatus]